MRLQGLFTLLAPLSHIGESISTESYLNEEPVVQPDGTTEPVFVYNGNAWRGQLRDLAAEHLLHTLGRDGEPLRVPLPAFHLLFSGGSIGGEQSIDLQQARTLRHNLPSLSLLGGGVGTQILPGKIIVGNSYPVCLETLRLVPERFRPAPELLRPYRELTMAKSFTRTDDAKDPAATEQHLTMGNGDVVQQMRYTVELLAAGVQLYSYLILDDPAPCELGVLVAALRRFAQRPFIGGQSRVGHGRVDLHYTDAEGATWFAADGHGDCTLSAPAQSALAAYEHHLAGLDPSIVRGVVA